jgi:geranylgeranyl reductase family protein
MRPEFDVAIVGGGPAGSWTAYHLAIAGARVAILDGSHPREKPCGGGLSARALDRLRPMGALPAGVDAVQARFAAPGARAAVSLRAGAPALIVVARRDLDSALLNAAVRRGAEHVPQRAAAFTRTDSGWTVDTSGRRLSAAWIVGADGVNSLVRRRVLEAFARTDISIASGYYVRGRTGTDVDIEFTSEPPGYLWSFPRPDHLAVGTCGQADATSSRDLFEASRRWIAAHVPTTDECLTAYSWPIPSLTPDSLRRQRSAGDRWLLIGDAAGLVDPITREGIFFALQSAEFAASSLSGGNVAGTYSRLLARHIHPELARAARMKERFFGPTFSRLLVRALDRSERIAAIMADLVAGRQTYHGLRRRLVLTGELRLALAYLRLTLGCSS